jgi:putative membrane protein
MNRSALAVLLVALSGPLAAAPAFAQDTGGDQPSNAPAVDTQTFVTSAMSGDQFELRSSEIALQGEVSGDVQAFARMMIEDHTLASQTFMQALQEAEGVETSSTAPMLDRHQQTLARLEPLSGRDLEAAYLEAQLIAHQEAVALYRAYATSGQDPALRRFAETTLPTLEAHFEAVEGLIQRR